MIRISDALKANIEGNPFLEFGLHHGLFNLSQLARHLLPHVESRTLKAVQPTALTMALSRLQRDMQAATAAARHYTIDRVTIHSGLCTATYSRRPEVLGVLNRLYEQVHREGGYCSLSQGQHEVTVTLDRDRMPDLMQRLRARPVFRCDDLAAIGVQFDPRYARIPGMLYMLLQRVALHNVNLIEVTSTFTEIHLFVAEEDTRTVFDLLYASFLSKSGRDSPL
jgi:hypothetical protein